VHSNSHSSTTGCYVQLSGFLDYTRTEICSPDCAMALIGILQMADGHTDGILMALGHSWYTAWFNTNDSAFFCEDCPFWGSYKSFLMFLLHHFHDTQPLAQIGFQMIQSWGCAMDAQLFQSIQSTVESREC
jgi:hypothetical protein